MADQEHHIVFQGNTLPGMPIEAVKRNLAKLFQADAARIERLFCGRAVILKKGLSPEEGERYRLLLEKAGALCDLVPSAGLPTPPPRSADQGSPQAFDARRKNPPSPVPLSEAAKAPRTGQRGAAPGEAATARQVGGLHQTLEALREKARKIGGAEDREKGPLLLAGLTAAAGSVLQKSGIAGPERRRRVWAIAAAGIGMIVVLAVMMAGGSRPMPIESAVFEKFARQYYREMHKIDLGSVATNELIGRAREVLEGMGFDFDRTLLLWLLRKEQVEERGGLAVYNTILVEPVAVAVAAGLSGIDAHIAGETREIFMCAAAIPRGVDLLPIRMIQACPTDGYRLKHADLLRVLEEHDVPSNGASPDLAIADAFFGLEQAGFIKIQRRWEKDDQFSDIEILDPQGMRRVEQQLERLAAIKAEFEEE